MTCINASIGLFEKDSNAILDYTVDWTSWLDGDTISTSTWIIPSGITKTNESNDDENAVVWISGGTAGNIYSIVNRIVTAAGRQDDRTIRIKVVNK